MVQSLETLKDSWNNLCLPLELVTPCGVCLACGPEVQMFRHGQRQLIYTDEASGVLCEAFEREDEAFEQVKHSNG